MLNMLISSLIFILILFQQIVLNQSADRAMAFLEDFGYLPEMNENELNLISKEKMESAIKLMQFYANIPQTGIVDDLTLETMNSPRCGLPDTNQTNGNRFNKHKRFKRGDFYKSKWEKTPLLWNFNRPSRSIPRDTARGVFIRAFDIWSKASDKLRFIETNDPKADILIGFYTGDHGDGKRQAFDGPGIKLAHAYYPPNGNVHFDDDEDWLNQDKGVNLFWTALHEFGHALGFTHTADKDSIMFPYYQDFGDNFDLPEVDKASVRYLYDEIPIRPTSESPRRPQKTSTPKNTIENDPKKVALDKVECHTSIDAIASIRKEIFVFKNNSFWWVKNDLTMVDTRSIPISDYFIGFPKEIERVDAVYERRSDQMIMFFVGRKYWLFNANQYYDGPRPITDLGLPNSIDQIDDAFVFGRNGRTYLLTGPVYWRMDDKEERVEEDYPREMTVWKGVPSNVDAAFTWRFDRKTYFFKGQFYWRFDNEKMSTDDEPQLIRDFLFRSIDCSRHRKSNNIAHSLKRLEGRSISNGATTNISLRSKSHLINFLQIVIFIYAINFFGSLI